ncbi:MAG: DUF4389 domain-containing protein [Gammaproteobacteria bacterium]|nr:DUF4389 domain-containing protein [Gammaproteobacteria bacterium]
MEEEIKQRLTSKDIWIRGLTMLFFGIAYSIAELVIFLVAVFQFLTILFTGRANEKALALGNNLSTYVYQVFQFQTFNTEERPFPFSDWPDEQVGENAWSGDSVDAGVVEEDPVIVEDDPIIIDQDPPGSDEERIE